MAEDYFTQFTNNARETSTRRDGVAGAAEAAADAQARQAATSAGAGDGNGYWIGGQYKLFFRLGVSKFGDGSVFR